MWGGEERIVTASCRGGSTTPGSHVDICKREMVDRKVATIRPVNHSLPVRTIARTPDRLAALLFDLSPTGTSQHVPAYRAVTVHQSRPSTKKTSRYKYNLRRTTSAVLSRRSESSSSRWTEQFLDVVAKLRNKINFSVTSQGTTSTRQKCANQYVKIKKILPEKIIIPVINRPTIIQRSLKKKGHF